MFLKWISSLNYDDAGAVFVSCQLQWIPIIHLFLCTLAHRLPAKKQRRRIGGKNGMIFPFPIQISVFVWEIPQTPATGEKSAGKTPCNSLPGTRRRASRKACASTRTRHTTREAPKWTDTLSETKLDVWGFPIFLQVNSPRYIKRPAGAVTLFLSAEIQDIGYD